MHHLDRDAAAASQELEVLEAAPRRGILGAWLAAASHPPAAADDVRDSARHVSAQAPWTSMFQQDDEVTEHPVIRLSPSVSSW